MGCEQRSVPVNHPRARVSYSARMANAEPLWNDESIGYTAALHPGPLILTCERCEVTWRGRPESTCWSCGDHGTASERVLMVD